MLQYIDSPKEAASCTITASSNDYNYYYRSDARPFKCRFGGGYRIIKEFNNLLGFKDVYIKKVLYNDPVTVVFWSDNTKTVAKCYEGDIYNPESGLAICVLKKLTSGKEVKELFNDWLPTQGNIVEVKDVRKKHGI